MKFEALGVTALVKELAKLSAVAGLAATTTLSIWADAPQESVGLTTDTVLQERVETVEVPADTLEDAIPAEVRRLLTFLQRFESAGAVKSQGVETAYQVVYGGIAEKHRPPVALTRMTVAEVLAWQDSIDPLYRSEAAGAYQVMEDTLRGLVNAGLVDPNAMFDAATQDAVALLLLERRGMSKFVEGAISAEAFADNLAREWASLPVVRDQKGASRFVKRGQSYYAGDGLNKAHADADEVLRIIGGIPVNAKKAQADTNRTSVGIGAQVKAAEAKDANSGDATNSGVFTLGATKAIDGPIEIGAQLGMTAYRGWDVDAQANYELGSDTYHVGGTVRYEKDNMTFTFGGTHDSDDNTEFKAELAYRF